MMGPPYMGGGGIHANAGVNLGGIGGMFPGAGASAGVVIGGPPMIRPPMVPSVMAPPMISPGIGVHAGVNINAGAYPYNPGMYQYHPGMYRMRPTPSWHMGVPGINPHAHWGASMGMVPWMNGGGSFWASTGGWGNHTGSWNNAYGRQSFGPPGGGYRDDFFRRQQMQVRQNLAVQERVGVAAQTQQLQSRGLYDNFYNAGADYYGQGMLSGGMYGSAPFGPRNLGCQVPWSCQHM